VTGGFALVFAAFFSPVLCSGKYLTTVGDGSSIALPQYLVPHGLWEPNVMLGYPWAANFNGGWDPLFALHLIPRSFNVYMLSAYVIAAVGAFACVDVLRRSIIGGVVAGISYALGGFMIEHLGHYDIVHPAAWTPWVFWALLLYRRNRAGWSIACGSAAFALCALAGQPQVVAYTLLFAVAFIFWMGLCAPRRGKFIAGALVMLLLGLGGAAIALVPGALLGFASFRAHPSLDYFLAFSLPPWQIPVRLLFPYVVGQSSQPVYPWSTVGIGSNAELSAYVGIGTLVLGISAILTRRRDPDVLFFALAAALALLLSTGDGLHIATITFHCSIYFGLKPGFYWSSRCLHRCWAASVRPRSPRATSGFVRSSRSSSPSVRRSSSPRSPSCHPEGFPRARTCRCAIRRSSFRFGRSSRHRLSSCFSGGHRARR
jgi:hypothetical protein